MMKNEHKLKLLRAKKKSSPITEKEIEKIKQLKAELDTWRVGTVIKTQDISELKKAIQDLTDLIKAGLTINNIQEAKSVFPPVKMPEIKVPAQKIIKQDDIFDVYKIADTDESSDTLNFFGFVRQTGEWFILREDGDTNKTYRYAVGKNNYFQAWKQRVKLDYLRFDEVNINV